MDGLKTLIFFNPQPIPCTPVSPSLLLDGLDLFDFLLVFFILLKLF